MKKLALGIVCAICAVCQIKADVFTHTFRFYASDFGFDSSNGDSLVISSLSSAALYPDVTEPGIPKISRSVALPQGASVKDYTVSFSKRLLRSGVDLKNAPQPIPTNAPYENMWISPGCYAPKVYPDSNCVRSLSYQLGGVNVVGFIMTPFVFDAAERNLYFIDSLKVSINMEVSSMRKAPAKVRPQQLEALQSVVDNPEAIAGIPVLTAAEEDTDDYIEYIIITNEALKDSFQPLAEWKRKKGVTTEILTVEEIYEKYPQETQQMSIKACITDYYENNFTQFVLLGGDVDKVPVQLCFAQMSDAVNEHFRGNFPADVYYSCLDQLDWDTNHNGKVGEFMIDRFSIVPTISVTRAPVRNKNEVDIFVNRTIEYEKNPVFTRDFFQGGYSLSSITSAEHLGDLLFNDVINQKIILGNCKFYDTFTYTGEPFSSQSFSKELEKGYQFAEIISHGDSIAWVDEFERKSYFNSQQALNLNNIGHTLITTMACRTNAFDQKESDYRPNPCLSEAFFRNPSSGVIGYLGCSREGWYSNSLTLSMAYETDFYKRLLYNDGSYKPANKNFGLLLYFTRHALMNLAYYSENESIIGNQSIYRWLYYGINAIGDPEMPIFNTIPYEINNASAEFDNDGILNVNTGLQDCRVCVSSADNGEFYEVQRGKELSFSIKKRGEYDVWITKQNYKPQYIKCEYNPSYDLDSGKFEPVPNRIVSISPNPATTQVTILYNVLASISNPKVQFTFTNINGLSIYTRDVPVSGTTATFNISGFLNGTYIVNLVVNGEKTEATYRLIKQ